MNNTFEIGGIYSVNGSTVRRVTITKRTEQYAYYTLDVLTPSEKFVTIAADARAKVYTDDSGEFIKTNPNCSTYNLCYAKNHFEDRISDLGGIESAAKYVRDLTPTAKKHARIYR